MFYFMNKINILNGDLTVHASFVSFCFYIYFYTQFFPCLLIQHSHSSGKLTLHLGPFHPPIYPHGPPRPEISAKTFPGGLQATLNESISVAPASVWSNLLLLYSIDGLQSTLHDSIYIAPDSVWDSLVIISSIYIPRSITSSLVNFSIWRVIVQLRQENSWVGQRGGIKEVITFLEAKYLTALRLLSSSNIV